MSRLIDGIMAYRRHPFHRSPAPPRVIWQEGGTRMLAHGDGVGAPLLVIPSLVNRHYVLDLLPGRSLLDFLDRAGFAPFTVDWGVPGAVERAFTLTDYIAGRLEGALDAVMAETGRAPGLIGYCMGGLLALALADRRGADIPALVLLATPWDFSATSADVGAPDPVQSLRLAQPLVGACLDRLGVLPTDAIQAMFHALDPLLAVRKFLAFAEMDMQDSEAEAFVALEDWLNDGVPLAAPVAREVLFGWYGLNAPASGNWRVAGRPVEPARITVPALALIPSRDRIVPPASAAALAARLANATEQRIALGHIGMVASARAESLAWTGIAEWLQNELG